MKKKMRAVVVGSVATCLVLAGGNTANAAQGGFDTSGGSRNHHSWMKVSKAELRNNTVDQACREVFRGPVSECNNLVVLIVQQKSANPNANGYWAENYYNTRTVRSGTW